MSYQKRAYWCGPASLQIALRFHGVRRGQAKLARMIGSTEDGSDEHDLIETITKLGFRHDECAAKRANTARSWLLRWAAVAPILLCVDHWEHWVCVAGQCGDRLLVFDPARSKLTMPYNGVLPIAPKTIIKRWRAARRLGIPYYGLTVLPPS